MALIRNEITSGCSQTYNAKGRAKFFWYPQTGDPPAHYTPTVWFDGVSDQTGVWTDISYTQSVYRDSVNSRRAIPSPIELSMDVDYGAHGDTGTVHVQVVATDTVPHAKLHVRIALVEDSLFQSGDRYDQVLRDYLPTYIGYLFSTISEGDTIEHSEDFVVDPDWDVNKMRVVAFVQNGKDTPLEYEVLQALQEPIPVFVPVPQKVTGLTVALVESDLMLNWAPVEADTSGNPITVDNYQVYRDTIDSLPAPEIVRTTSDTFFVDDSGVVGDTGTQYYYAVTAVLGSKESDYSAAAGEFDRYVATGK
jgi:hypothetical protein